MLRTDRHRLTNDSRDTRDLDRQKIQRYTCTCKDRDTANVKAKNSG